jgi:hypothetical protein
VSAGGGDTSALSDFPQMPYAQNEYWFIRIVLRDKIGARFDYCCVLTDTIPVSCAVFLLFET